MNRQGPQFRHGDQRVVAAPYQSSAPAHIQQTGMMAAPANMQHQFYFKAKSEVDGNTYEGQFTVKKLSIKDIGAIGVRKTQLNGGYHYDDERPGAGVPQEIDMINQMISYLEVAVIQAPMWFDLDQIYDGSILGSIFQQASEFENSFFRSIRKANEPSGSSQDAGSGESPEAGASGRVEEVVGGEVQGSLDP